MSIGPGVRVGVRGWGARRNIVDRGPFTVSRRPVNPADQHMWEFSNTEGAVSEILLFPWINGLEINDPVPTQKTLANVTKNKLRNQTLRNVWEKSTGINSTPGHGPLNLIKKFNGSYKRYIGGKKNKSRKNKTRKNF
jgi:hypothetical protein